MTKYVLASIAALCLVAAPVASIAQDGAKSSDESGSKMKGPPNANGYKGEQTSGGKKDDNGAAAAKSTGEDKK